MANIKTGFNFYNVDTDRYQDMKIKRLKKDFGCAGIAVYDYILCEIYRVKGCFLVWDESIAFDVADYFGIKESLVNEIVSYCCVVGLYNKELLTSESVITSLSIQDRYVDMCIRAKRVHITVPEKIKLTEKLNILTEESLKLTEESNQTSGSLPQSIVEYSKVNNIPPSPPLKKGGSSKPRKKKETNSINQKARLIFENHVNDTYGFAYYWSAKDAGSMSALINKLKFQRQHKGLEISDDLILGALKSFLKHTSTIKDDFIQNNFSVPIINSKFNEILGKIRNESKQSKVSDVKPEKTVYSFGK